MHGPNAGKIAEKIGDEYDLLFIDYHEKFPERVKWYDLAGQAGNVSGWMKAGYICYLPGVSDMEDYDKAIEFYKKVYDMYGKEAAEAAQYISDIYFNLKIRNGLTDSPEEHKWSVLAQEEKNRGEIKHPLLLYGS